MNLMLLSATFALQLGDMLVQFIEVLALLGQLLL